MDRTNRMTRLALITPVTFLMKLFSLIADAAISIGYTVRRKTFQAGKCFVVLGMVTCLLPSSFRVEIVKGIPPQRVDTLQGAEVDPAMNAVVATPVRTHAHWAAPHRVRSRMSSDYLRRATTPGVSWHSPILGTNSQALLHPNEQSVHVAPWFSDAITPVKATLALLC